MAPISRWSPASLMMWVVLGLLVCFVSSAAAQEPNAQPLDQDAVFQEQFKRYQEQLYQQQQQFQQQQAQQYQQSQQQQPDPRNQPEAQPQYQQQPQQQYQAQPQYQYEPQTQYQQPQPESTRQNQGEFEKVQQQEVPESSGPPQPQQTQSFIPPPVPQNQQYQPEPQQYQPPPPQYRQENGHQTPPSPSPTSQYTPQPPQPKPVEALKPKLGIVDKWIDVIFGLPKFERDPKFAKPWQTHPEFMKRTGTQKASDVPEKVDTSSGFIGKFINRMIGIVFVIPTGERDPKYAQPWKTHKEHMRSSTVQDAPKGPKQSLFHFECINTLVEKIFGKVPEGRDEKWARPWQTHPEHQFQKVAAGSANEQREKVETSSKLGDAINRFVYAVFGQTGSDRNPKYAQPWQTHLDMRRTLSSAPGAPTEKIDTSSGFIGNLIHKAVLLVFEDVKTPRDPKYAQPWQTHPEHTRKPKADLPDVRVVQTGGLFGLEFKLLNTLVESVFGKHSEQRSSKWAQSWHTHPEHAHAAPSHAVPRPTPQYQPPPPPPPPTQYQPPPPPPTHYQPPPQPQYQPPPPQTHYQPPPQEPTRYQAPPPPPPQPEPTRYQAPTPEFKPQPTTPVTTQKTASQIETPSVQKPKEEEKVDSPPAKPKTFPSQPQNIPPKVEAPKSAPPPPAEVVNAPKAPIQQVLEEQKRERKIEDEEEIMSIPSTTRTRDHIHSILALDEASGQAAARMEPVAQGTLQDIKKIYENSIRPLETTFKYHDISNRHLSDSEIFGPPMILLLGPYSTGKSTFINYLLGIEYTPRALKTGTPPSHGSYRIVQYGDHDRNLDGTDISGHPAFASLQKFGQNFVDQINGKALNVPLLKKATFVEAPGILEMRRPGERLYPYNDVAQWFIDRADLILLMFDYTKLDAGYEMEAILDQLKGREAQTRILLNKADKVPSEELIKVQGSLFWNLSPLLGVSAPPTVYAGSFASMPYRVGSAARLFQAQEEALLHDIARAISNRVENRIAITRRHAVRVRSHAQMVDTYLQTYYRNKGFLTSKHKLAEEIVENPHAYNIYEGLSMLTNVSRYDLPDAEVYRDFFRIHSLYEFQTLRETCTFLSGCPLEKINTAISRELPELITRHRRLMEAAEHNVRLPKAPLRQQAGMGPATVSHHKNTL